jgi:purine nucleosidase
MTDQIVLSCDPGIDDALAIVFLSKLGSLKAIWTTMGNNTLENCTQNAARVLNLLGERQIPIIKGAAEPLSGPIDLIAGVHGKDGLGDTDLPLPDLEDFTWETIDFINSSIVENPHKITLVSTGPLMNLANLIQNTPRETLLLFKDIIIMGGAINIPGNVTPYAEFNVFCDPKAAKIVFASGLPLTLVGLDVSQKAIMTETHIRLLEAKSTPLTNFLVQIVRFYSDFHKGLNGCYLHNPLAAAVALDSTLITKKKAFNIDAVVDDPVKEGQTIPLKNAKNANVSVCLELKTEKFLKFFINALLK